MAGSFRAAVKAARLQEGLYFAALLSEQRILNALSDADTKFQGWIYTAQVTVWMFLSQCLSADHSCRDAVARLIAWRVSWGLKACSADTSAYCTARDRLPEEVSRRLMRETGRETDAQAPTDWRWKRRRALLVDGSTITLPDTPENQAEYPQQSGQAPGCGFPIARIVVVFSLAVGTVLEAALGPYRGKQTGENSLLRTLHPAFEPGDVLVLDRYFSGWFDLALLAERGVDVVVRKHQLRATDFRTGRRLGRDDHLVTWPKPARLAWMDVETYERLPTELTHREIRVRVTQKGFRTKVLLLVTTLLDADEYMHADLAEVYRYRWQAELNLRSLKIVMDMDHLRCQTPHRVRNEFLMHLLAYNLIRQVMVTAAVEAGAQPWRISFREPCRRSTSSCLNSTPRCLWRRGGTHCSPPSRPTRWATVPTATNRDSANADQNHTNICARRGRITKEHMFVDVMTSSRAIRDAIPPGRSRQPDGGTRVRRRSSP